MARRKTANYRGLLARPIDPWRDHLPTALAARRRQLLSELGVSNTASDADARAVQALLARHGITRHIGETDLSGSLFISIAAALVPGFRLTVRGYTLGSIYAARCPRTRSSELDAARIIQLVRLVEQQASISAGGRRKGVKRSIHELTKPEGPFFHLRRHERRLEWMYYRHRSKLVPDFPRLDLCARPSGQPCFSGDETFEMAPTFCRLKPDCPFWTAWENWANHAATEYVLERATLISIEYYRRLASRRRRPR